MKMNKIWMVACMAATLIGDGLSVAEHGLLFDAVAIGPHRWSIWL